MDIPHAVNNLTLENDELEEKPLVTHAYPNLTNYQY